VPSKESGKPSLTHKLGSFSGGNPATRWPTREAKAALPRSDSSFTCLKNADSRRHTHAKAMPEPTEQVEGAGGRCGDFVGAVVRVATELKRDFGKAGKISGVECVDPLNAIYIHGGKDLQIEDVAGGYWSTTN